MGRILEKKEAAEYDEEMMELLSSILIRNPDISTLWNIRRNCLLKLKEQEGVDIQNEFERDLIFAEQSLHANPKSYCAWHHRCWLLANSPAPNWEHEVSLCTKYLKMDERNCMCALNVSPNQNSITFRLFFQFTSGTIVDMWWQRLTYLPKMSWTFVRREFRKISRIIRRGMRAQSCCPYSTRTKWIDRGRLTKMCCAMSWN